MEIKEKEDKVESRILEQLLSMILDENMKADDAADDREKALKNTTADGQADKDDQENSGLIYCSDPYEFSLLFTPGEGAIPISQEECWHIITSGGEHQITRKFGNGKYLISYDERHVFHTAGGEYINGPVFLIALDGSEFTRDMDRGDICYLTHQLECRVRKNMNGKAVLLIGESMRNGKGEDLISR